MHNAKRNLYKETRTTANCIYCILHTVYCIYYIQYILYTVYRKPFMQNMEKHYHGRAKLLRKLSSLLKSRISVITVRRAYCTRLHVPNNRARTAVGAAGAAQ